ncbi:RDD family protein [Dyella sp. ASV21]|uniref:RDD family protein n=1 Tax=Dyella sp. ASV21 TaxID=2795114 RepID=UPI0018EC274E|nr:RDD family protein [Dyella sp. ASV21]
MMQEAGRPALVIASFWRRLGAFAIDALILGLGGLFIGALSFDGLARLGIYGRVLGFIIALGYFGLFNSRYGEGQTPGKKLLGLRVVDAGGQCIALPKSLLRYAVLGLPFFLNNLPLGQPQLESWWSYPLGIIVFGAGLSSIYLYIFNRRTRQSLHDLAVGTYVVRVADDQVPAPLSPVWRGHGVVVGLLIVLPVAAAMLGQRLMGSGWLADLTSVYQAVSVQPHVSRATVQKSFVSVNGRTSHYLVASLNLDASMVDDENYARDIARIMASKFPDVTSQNAVIVELVYGYDIGIASGRKSHRYSFKPEALQ